MRLSHLGFRSRPFSRFENHPGRMVRSEVQMQALGVAAGEDGVEKMIEIA